MGGARDIKPSNTTTLPAKIYANEVLQMLLESDEVCETSYADRGGKYQGNGVSAAQS